MGKYFNKNDADIAKFYAEESFIADVQFEISKLMIDKDVSRSDLARRLNVSPAQISQMLGHGSSNLTARSIARIYAALGEEPCICSKSAIDRATKASGVSDNNWQAVAGANASRWSVEQEQLGAKTLSASDSRTVVWLDAYRKAA